MIVPMAKVEVLGPRRRLGEALAFLQRQGVLQLRPLPDELGLGRIPLSAGEAQEAERLERIARRAAEVLASLPQRRSGGAAILDLAGVEAAQAGLDELAARRAVLEAERDIVARYGRLLAALAPLQPGTPNVEAPHRLGVMVNRDPQVLDLLAEEMARLTGGAFDLQWAQVDERHLGVLLAVPERCAREASALLFERGMEEMKLPAPYAGQALGETLALLARREREIPGEVSELERAGEAWSARWSGSLRATLRDARVRLGRLRAASQCGETSHAFVATGWIPREQLAALAQAIDPCFAIVEVPIVAEDEVPVVLRNRAAVRPFELLLTLVGLPRYGSIDPTPYLAVFFPVFFGLILGDAGFGVIGLGLAVYARRRGLNRDAASIALWCAASAIVFGILFGEAFGGLGERIGLRPVLFDRRSAFLALLALAVGLGMCHVALGLALGAVDAARHHRVREAVGRAARLGMLVACAAGVVAGSAVAAAAALGLMMVVAVAAEGPMAILELVLSLGNVLSYARLMALGLASVLLAEVANSLGATLHPAPLGIALAILLHAANFALALVSPTIAALRLHYVEFFDKFFEGGGSPYQPFSLASQEVA